MEWNLKYLNKVTKGRWNYKSLQRCHKSKNESSQAIFPESIGKLSMMVCTSCLQLFGMVKTSNIVKKMVEPWKNQELLGNFYYMKEIYNESVKLQSMIYNYFEDCVVLN